MGKGRVGRRTRKKMTHKTTTIRTEQMGSDEVHKNDALCVDLLGTRGTAAQLGLLS